MRTSTLATLFAALALIATPMIALAAQPAPAVTSTPARAPAAPAVPVPAAEAAQYAAREAEDKAAEEFRGNDPVLLVGALSAGVIVAFVTVAVLLLVLL